MERRFDPTERRILGTLVEKSLTTPDQYPLTLNALLSGCNQRSNRDPILALQEFEVEGALRALQGDGYVAQVGTAGGRALRFRERLVERLGLERPEAAVLAELLLRGPQARGELRGRANRMAILPDLPSLAEALDGLIAKGLVARLPKESGTRAERFGHLLAPEEEEEGATGPDEGAPAKPPPSASEEAGGPNLAERVKTLEARVAALEARLEELGA